MRGIEKRFGATLALRGVDLSVSPGEIMALVGENGAGKSTLMKVLSGAHSPDDGSLFLDGEPYTPTNPLHARESGVAMIYQELSLAPHLSTMENILLGIEPCNRGLIRWNEMKRQAGEAMRAVGLGSVDPETPVSQLSIAQQQLVEIARAVALESRVLVLDEPTSSLAAQDIENLFDLVRSLSAKGISVIYISHFLEEVQILSDRFTVLRDGESVGGGVTADASKDSIIALMVGRNVDDLYPRNEHIAGEVVLGVENISGFSKPGSSTLKLREGEVFGIAGLVGAGRTELLESIFGLEPVAHGQVTVGSYSGPTAPALSWEQNIGMVSEDRKTQGLALGLSIADNITLPMLQGLGPGRLVLPSQQRAACEPWIEEIPIKCESAEQRTNDLSGGNQQKVAIARLLHADVNILLLDEPTRGIDVASKAQIYRLIDSLARGDKESGRQPKAILLVSSYLPELLGVCDRIAVMRRGDLGVSRPVEEWDEHQLMAAAIG
jgi:ribose transport system ATP-binding protein